jgi:hypothetical protein
MATLDPVITHAQARSIALGWRSRADPWSALFSLVRTGEIRSAVRLHGEINCALKTAEKREHRVELVALRKYVQTHVPVRPDDEGSRGPVDGWAILRDDTPPTNEQAQLWDVVGTNTQHWHSNGIAWVQGPMLHAEAQRLVTLTKTNLRPACDVFVRKAAL